MIQYKCSLQYFLQPYYADNVCHIYNAHVHVIREIINTLLWLNYVYKEMLL